MGKLLRKLALWMKRAIASETSGGIAWNLMVALSVVYTVEYLWEKIL